MSGLPFQPALHLRELPGEIGFFLERLNLLDIDRLGHLFREGFPLRRETLRNPLVLAGTQRPDLRLSGLGNVALGLLDRCLRLGLRMDLLAGKLIFQGALDLRDTRTLLTLDPRLYFLELASADRLPAVRTQSLTHAAVGLVSVPTGAVLS